MTALNDERRPGGGGESSSSLARPLQSTPQRRQDDVWHATADVYRVLGVRGRSMSVIVVERCPFCRCRHVHSGKIHFGIGKRTASCHRGKYLVHLGTEAGSA